MKIKQIYLFTGKARNGKDTVAGAIASKLLIKKYNIANFLKKEVSDEYDIPLWIFDSDIYKDVKIGKYNKSPRELLIKYANMKKEKFNKYYFIKKLCNTINRTDSFAIADCRFYHEVDFVKKYFSDHKHHLIWVERNISGINDNLEIKKQDCDIIYINNKDLNDIIIEPFNS